MMCDDTDVYAFEPGDCFVMRVDADDPDPEDYWSVTQRYWCHDPKTYSSEWTSPEDRRQYRIGRIVTMGDDEMLVNEIDLISHFREVSDEEATAAIREYTPTVEE